MLCCLIVTIMEMRTAAHDYFYCFCDQSTWSAKCHIMVNNNMNPKPKETSLNVLKEILTFAKLGKVNVWLFFFFCWKK